MFCTLFLLFASVAAKPFIYNPNPGPFPRMRYAAEDVEDTAYGILNIGCGGNDKKHKKLAFKPEDVEDKIDIGLHVVIGNDGKKYLVMTPEDVDDRIKFDGHLVIDEAGKIHAFDAEDVEDTAYGLINIGCGGNDKKHKKLSFVPEDVEDTAYGILNIGCGGNDKKHKKVRFTPEDLEDRIKFDGHLVIDEAGKMHIFDAEDAPRPKCRGYITINKDGRIIKYPINY